MTAAARLLIVEDNDQNLKLARDVLGHVGYRDGRGARRRGGGRAGALATGPDLILMDIQLPGMDGLEALARLRADPGRPASRSSRSPRSR